MQAFHPNGDQVYYPQHQYGQPPATYVTTFAAYPSYLPGQGNVAAPFPTYPAEYAPPSQFPTPAPPRKKLSRSASAAPSVTLPPSRSSTPAGPLKSAMKKPPDRSASAGGAPLTRHRTTSGARQRVNSLTRTRSNSMPSFTPDHLFLSVHSVNELRIGNIAYQSTLDELREAVLPMWPPGVMSEESRGRNWCVRFAGSPWTSVGIDGILAQRLICRLFLVLANQGYSYRTTVNTANSGRPPQLVFVESDPDQEAQIFLTSFSRSVNRLSLLDAPPDVAQQLAAGLRSVFPRKISSFGANEDGVHVIEMKREGLRSRKSDRDLFIAYMLHSFNDANFKLVGSVPLGKRGALGFGSRREVWVFQRTIRRPSKREKQ
ncbi:hypothetical protein AcW1_000640 [Taiwanofungus camphoratus]|nr:hypothetical protein AcV7_000657 [Antrodia cinnamomea]KAI0963607.1 hypothetical protein AcW1_000640 [Antrodia cinnamomea]